MKVHTFATDIQDPLRRGRQIGERWADEIRRTVSLYLDFFPRVGISAQQVRSIGDSSLGALEAWCPDLACEVMSIAAGAQLPIWQLASLNARTEILAVMPASTEGECSTAVYAPSGSTAPRTIQTWDWHDSLVPDGLLLQLLTRRGLTVKLFTEFGMLGKIGVNSAGLGLHFNILHHDSDNDDAGVPVHAIARRLLEEATTVQEAIELARSAKVSASTVLTVFSRLEEEGPRAASIELSPSRTAVVLPLEKDWILHTNHFLDPVLSQGERTPDKTTTYARLEHLHAVCSGMAVSDVRARAGAMCGAAGDQAPICFHADMSMPDTERWETLLTLGIDTENCALEYVAGNPKVLADEGFERF
ncbi:C45 family peptidase [Neisseriaceae bacterium JH1-16]|nr:C45 family peptidase [Neisseriaceae bacterium JH1-16]